MSTPNEAPLSLTSTKAETIYLDVANFPTSATYPMVGIIQDQAKRKEMGKEILSKYNPMELVLAQKSTENYASVTRTRCGRANSCFGTHQVPWAL